MKHLIFLFALLTLPQAKEQAPDFRFVTESGEWKNLSDFKDQVVYLSFWASWCKPCIDNFQKYKDLRMELDSAGVVLINVSIDTKKQKWDQALTTVKNLNGLNVYPQNYKEVNKAYDIDRIPAYHIVDKSGNFVFLSNKKSRNILEEFSVWLEE